jgi:hypothetical protein
MWRSVLTFLLLLSIASAEGQSPGKTISAHNYEFMNGRWFDGKGFVSRTFYSVGGSLSSRRPARVDSVFDLKWNYVVPPFGEAHPDQNLLKSEGVSRCEISEADARLAGKNNVVVVTTLGAAIDAVKRIDESAPNAPLRKEFKNLLIRNLQLLGEHNVRIAVGSDKYRQTSAFEASRLHELKVFDNLTLLKLWSETTAATIFPNRRIGRLKEGYEANFLVLAGNPVDDFSNTGRIEMRVKQGEILTLK